MKNQNKKALFSFKGESTHMAVDLHPNKVELFSKLRQRGIDPVVSLNAESAFSDTGVQAHELVSEDRTKPLGHVAIEDVGVLVNRLDRSFRREETTGKNGNTLPKLPDTWLEAAKPTINENEMRSLAFRKARVQAEVLEPLGLGIPTQLIVNPMDIALFAAENPAESYIIKPNSGSYSEGVQSMTVDEAIRMFTTDPPSKDMIIQPKLDFSARFDPSLKPYDTLSQEAFDAWNKTDAAKELRVYGFYSPTLIALFPAARAMKDGSEEWLFVDPDSVPDKVYEDTRSAIERAAHITGSRALMAAGDYGYGAMNGEDPGYHMVELNGKMPYMIGYDKHRAVASRLRDHYADMLQDTVEP